MPHNNNSNSNNGDDNDNHQMGSKRGKAITNDISREATRGVPRHQASHLSTHIYTQSLTLSLSHFQLPSLLSIVLRLAGAYACPGGAVQLHRPHPGVTTVDAK